MAIRRRDFLKAALAAAAAAWLPLPGAGPAQAGDYLQPQKGREGVRLSPYFKPLDGGFVECTLCPHACRVGPGERGNCGVRENREGNYYTLVYGNPCALHLDPVEKKPFFHLLPGTDSLSLATAGCNFHCKFCQNWEISQRRPEDTLNLDLPVDRVVELARGNGAASIASTYVEPTIFTEYMLDLGAAARKAGVLKVMHSNGYVNPEPLSDLTRVLDGACIDLKSAREDYYREVCGGELEPVKRTLRNLVKAGVHTEIVNLMVPGLNDGPEETRDLVRFVVQDLSPSIPVHFTRFHPQYKLANLPPTPVDTLEKARDLAKKEGLEFAYVGNVPGHPGESTECPHCGRLVIRRVGYQVMEMDLKDGVCPKCGKRLYGRWKA